jgi:hypothetical protein
MPTERAIYWTPVSSSYHFLGSLLSAASARYPLFVAQRVFAQLAASRAADEGKFEAGLLRGALCECPDTRQRYVTVERTERVMKIAQTADPLAAAAHLARALRERVAARPEGWVGWYRQQPEVGPQLATEDEMVDLELGAPLWHALLVATADGAGDGAFFAEDRQGQSSFEVPFFELLDAPVLRAHGAVVTVVDWEQRYTPSRPVEPLPAEACRHLLDDSGKTPSGIAAVIQPLRRWFGDSRSTTRGGRDAR